MGGQSTHNGSETDFIQDIGETFENFKLMQLVLVKLQSFDELLDRSLRLEGEQR